MPKYVVIINYVIGPTNSLWFYGCDFIVDWSPTYFGHSCGYVHGGEKGNTNINKMCPNHCTG
jgi:hypothetical protein